MSSKGLTARAEWTALLAHQRSMDGVHIRDLFEKDPQRAEKFTQTLPGLTFDYSKQRISEKTISLLATLADKCDLTEWRKGLYSGQTLNGTENRAALHMALRGSQPKGLKINGEDVAEFVRSTLARIQELSEKVRSDASITDIIHIGIGGSDLGPRLVCRALASKVRGPKIHFMPNVDGQAFYELQRTLKPESTLVIVVSKTFTTMETLTNARTVKAWLEASMPADQVKARLMGVTMNEELAEQFGITREHILPLRDWIGGRFSLWGAVGLPIAIAIGYDGFSQLLAGAQAADAHFMEARFPQNIPVLMALIGIWNRNFWHYNTHAMLAYSENLEHLKTYVQQMDMESNGKGVTGDGQLLDYETGPVVFGEIGTNAQHAFMQHLHQSSEIIPSDFVLIAQPEHPYHEQHIKLVSNALAQSKALMEGHANDGQPHLSFEGNRPSSTIILDKLDPWHLGLLLAVYEHKIFVQGAIWNINSFDQWGVELGKTIAHTIIENFENDAFLDTMDSSTASLLRALRQKFTKS